MQFNSFKTGGIVFKICETQFIPGKKGEFQKREIWVEIPTQNSMDTNTEIFVFETIFDETGMLDNYTEGKWVDIVFRVSSRRWTDPKTNKEKVFNSFKLIDMKHAPNPFDKGKDLRHTPDDLSNTIVSELGDKVKDWINEAPKRDTMFDEDGNFNDDVDELPF